MCIRRFVKTVGAAAAVLLLSIGIPSAADAGSILPSSPVVTAVAGGVNWDYDVSLTSGSQLQTGNFFVIYDFGIGSLVSAPVGWTLTTSALSPTSIGALTPTQTSSLNYAFTYNGPTLTAVSNLNLGHFVLFATLGTGGLASFGSQNYDAFGALTSSLTTVAVAAVATAPVPEPATLLLFGTGLAAAVARRRPKGRT